jgi:hypothetical protein
MNTIAPIKTLTLNPKQLSRIQKAKATGKHLFVHMLNSGKLIISWKLIRPSQNSDIVAVSEVRFMLLSQPV